MLLRYSLCLLGSVAAHAGVVWYGIPIPEKLASNNSLFAWNIIFWAYTFTYAVSPHKKDGDRWPWFQKLAFWRKIIKDTAVHAETPLDHDKQYIFAAFPHGAISANHIMTMTDCCGFLSDVHGGDRRDLAASILFYLPIAREILLWLGNVDAGKSTAKHQLQRGRSLLVFVGGEKEQLMTQPNSHKVYAKTRMGFVKLALEYGVPLVPMYCYGENEAYHVSGAFMRLRQWLQSNLSIGISLFWGRGFLWMKPLDVHLDMELATPVPVPSKFAGNSTADKGKRVLPSEEELAQYHKLFLQALSGMFEKTKGKYGVAKEVHLDIL